MNLFAKTSTILVLLVPACIYASLSSKSSLIGDFVTNTTKRVYIDLFVGDNLYLYCNLKEAIFYFESYTGPLKLSNVTDIKDEKVSFKNTFDHILLIIREVKTTYSGLYICRTQTSNGNTIWEVTVHDVHTFKYVMLDRKQTSARKIEMGDAFIHLVWTKWTLCDGCARNGEKRRFGFWYVSTHDQRKYQKNNHRNMPFLIKPFAKSARNEIAVKICYEPCESDKSRIKTQKSLRMILKTGNNINLICPGNQSVHNNINWEKGYSSLLRTHDSYGYAPARPFYIAQDNVLQIHGISYKDRDEITIACTRDRYVKFPFELVKEKEQEIIVTLKEHLRTILLSMSLQITMFVFVLVVSSCARTWSEDVSMGRA